MIEERIMGTLSAGSFALFATLLATCVAHAAAPPGFMDAATAYEHAQYDRCTEILAAMNDDAIPLPRNGELLFAACLGAAGKVDDALHYLDAQLPGGRIDIGELRGKDSPGLNLIRQSPQWPALMARAEKFEGERLAKLDQPLRKELLDRVQKDQAARQAFIDGDNKPEAWKQRIDPIDHENTAWLKQIVAARGWPGNSLVGEDGANAAWLLVQHADADPAFQAQALSLMEPAVAKHDASPSDFALLTDRVLLAQDKQQRYGTQFQTGDDGVMRLRPTEDTAGLDARRRAIGLPSMDEYRQMLRDTYHQPVE
jgi:hypothetical protein